MIEDPVERRFGGRVSGVLWIGGGVVTLLPRLIGSTSGTVSLVVLVVIALLSCVWGLVSLFWLDWTDGPAWLMHLSTLVGTVTLSGVLFTTGDSESAGWAFFISAEL